MIKTFILIIAIIVIASCRKNHDAVCTTVTPQAEAASIASYCNANGIAYTKDTNGIFYQIVDPGSGVTPNLNSTITATYLTALLNGQVIDTTHFKNPIIQPLSQFIEGWRIAIPYIQQGGHIKMIIPSALAYGCTGIQNLVPANAPLFCDVLLLKVSN